jgi:hypothetical protein
LRELHAMNRALSLAMATIEKLTIQLDVYIRAILSHLERTRIVALRERPEGVTERAIMSMLLRPLLRVRSERTSIRLS